MSLWQDSSGGRETFGEGSHCADWHVLMGFLHKLQAFPSRNVKASGMSQAVTMTKATSWFSPPPPPPPPLHSTSFAAKTLSLPPTRVLATLLEYTLWTANDSQVGWCNTSVGVPDRWKEKLPGRKWKSASLLFFRSVGNTNNLVLKKNNPPVLRPVGWLNGKAFLPSILYRGGERCWEPEKSPSLILNGFLNVLWWFT